MQSYLTNKASETSALRTLLQAEELARGSQGGKLQLLFQNSIPTPQGFTLGGFLYA